MAVQLIDIDIDIRVAHVCIEREIQLIKIHERRKWHAVDAHIIIRVVNVPHVTKTVDGIGPPFSDGPGTVEPGSPRVVVRGVLGMFDGILLKGVDGNGDGAVHQQLALNGVGVIGGNLHFLGRHTEEGDGDHQQQREYTDRYYKCRALIMGVMV